MNVVDCLAAIFSRIDNDPITLGKSFGASYLCCGPLQMAEKVFVIFVGVSDGSDVFAGHDEDVDRRLRLQVSEGIALFILVDGFGGDTSVDDLAEYAAHVEESTGGGSDCQRVVERPQVADGFRIELLLFRRSLSGVEEAVNRLRQSAIEGSNACERDVD